MRRSRIHTFLGTVAVMLLGAGLAVAADATPENYCVFFGTYTGGKAPGASKGIYRSQFDARTGTLSEPELAAEVGSPSFLAIHPSKKYLYAVGEGAVKGNKGGGIYAFGLDAGTGKLTPLNTADSVGAGPCHVAVNPAGNLLTVANYGGGSTVMYKLKPDGQIGEQAAFIQHGEGSGANPNQKGPHGHCGAFDPSGNYSFTCDLGMDKVKVFKIDAAAGKVDDDAAADIDLPRGTGPRHIALAPDGKVAYVCGEINMTANVIELNNGTGKTVQSVPTVDKNEKGFSTAECILAPSGKFVYVSNRGHNTIAVFKVGDDRKLTPAGHITGDIKTPRNFNIDPTGKWMLIASQDGGQVGVWELDPTTGLGKETKTVVKVGRPVCVKFVAVAK